MTTMEQSVDVCCQLSDNICLFRKLGCGTFQGGHTVNSLFPDTKDFKTVIYRPTLARASAHTHTPTWKGRSKNHPMVFLSKYYFTVILPSYTSSSQHFRVAVAIQKNIQQEKA